MFMQRLKRKMCLFFKKTNTHLNLKPRDGTQRDFVNNAEDVVFREERQKGKRRWQFGILRKPRYTALVSILKAMTCLPKEARAHTAFRHIRPLKIILEFITLIWKHQIYGN
jgi:hypothetical protein